MKSLKIKGSSFFTKERWKVIQDVVFIVNDLTMRSTMLAKAYYLSKMEILELNSSFYNICFKVVSNQPLNHRRTAKDTAEQHSKGKNIYNDLKTIFVDKFNSSFVDLKNYSISQILTMASSDLETAMLNNTEFHYIK